MLAIHPETSYWATLWLSFLFCKMRARVGATRDPLLASSHCDSLKDHQAKGLSNGSINLVSKHLKNFTLKLYSPLIENKWQLSVVLHPGFKTACQVLNLPSCHPTKALFSSPALQLPNSWALSRPISLYFPESFSYSHPWSSALLSFPLYKHNLNSHLHTNKRENLNWYWPSIFEQIPYNTLLLLLLSLLLNLKNQI